MQGVTAGYNNSSAIKKGPTREVPKGRQYRAQYSCRSHAVLYMKQLMDKRCRKHRNSQGATHGVQWLQQCHAMACMACKQYSHSSRSEQRHAEAIDIQQPKQRHRKNQRHNRKQCVHSLDTTSSPVPMLSTSQCFSKSAQTEHRSTQHATYTRHPGSFHCIPTTGTTGRLLHRSDNRTNIRTTHHQFVAAETHTYTYCSTKSLNCVLTTATVKTGRLLLYNFWVAGFAWVSGSNSVHTLHICPQLEDLLLQLCSSGAHINRSATAKSTGQAQHNRAHHQTFTMKAARGRKA